MQASRAVGALLLIALSGLASATDYGVVSTLDFNLAPGESATLPQEVSRCRVEGCSDTLLLTATVPAGFSASVSPPQLKVAQAAVGQTFSANVTVSARVSAAPGRYEGVLQVTSGSGDTWSYRLNLTVRASSAAPPAPAPASGGTGSGPGAAAAPAAALPDRGGGDMTLPAVGGVVVAAVLLLVLLQRRGLLPRGAPRPSPRGPGRTARGSPPPGSSSPFSTALKPVGAAARTAAARAKGLASRVPGLSGALRIPSRGGRGAEEAGLESEWERFVREKLPGEAAAAGPEEAPPEEMVPGETEEPPPVAGDAPEEVVPEEEPPTPGPEEAPSIEPPPAGAEATEPAATGEEPAPEAPAPVSDEALLALRRDLDRLRSGMGTVGDLKTMVERALDDLRALREELDQVRSAPRPTAAPLAPAALPPDALEKLKAELSEQMAATLEDQMAANTEKLGTWLREALKAVTLMKAQTPQGGGSPGATGLQPLFDGLWKEVGSLRSALQRLDTETKSALQEAARQAPGGAGPGEAEALHAAIEKHEAAVAALARDVQALRSEKSKAAEPGVALSADLDALRTILRDIQRQMEGVEARLKNQELTFARGDEVRNLFRDLSALREDLAEVRMVVEEGRMAMVPAPPAAGGAVVERAARGPVEAPPAARREGPEGAEIQREIEKQEAFLKSLEEYRRSGLMPERLYLEKKSQSEERLKELKRKSRP